MVGDSMKKKSIKEYAEMSFLTRRKNDLNELAEENIIYEESQTGPQEEPTLKEIQLNLKSIKKKMRFNN